MLHLAEAQKSGITILFNCSWSEFYQVKTCLKTRSTKFYICFEFTHFDSFRRWARGYYVIAFFQHVKTIMPSEWRLCALQHWIQILIDAILACHPAVSTEWLAGWQYPVYTMTYAHGSHWRSDICWRSRDAFSLYKTNNRRRYSAPGLWEKAHLKRLDFPFEISVALSLDGLRQTVILSKCCTTPNWKFMFFSLPKASGICEKLNEPLQKRKFGLTTLSLISKYRSTSTESSETKNIVVTVLVPFAVPTNWKFPWTSEWHRTTSRSTWCAKGDCVREWSAWSIILRSEVRQHTSRGKAAFWRLSSVGEGMVFYKTQFWSMYWWWLVEGICFQCRSKTDFVWSTLVNRFILLGIHNTSLPKKSAGRRFRCFSLDQFSRVQTRSLLFFLFHFTQEHKWWFLPENASCLMCSQKLVLTSLHVALSWGA